MNKTLRIFLGIFLAAVVAGFLYLRRPQLSPTTTQKSPATVIPEASLAPETSGEVRQITVEGDEYSFSPKSLSVTAGERIRLTFKNNGNLPHNFTIDGLGVATRTIAGGQTDIVEFTAQTSETFTFYCSVGGHRELGMEGDLEVQ